MDVNKANKTLDELSKELSNLTLFKLLEIHEKLLNVITDYRQQLKNIKQAKTIIESEMIIKINSNNKIKTTEKKAHLELEKEANTEYTKLRIEYNGLQTLVERIENILKILDRKYKLIEPAFHATGVLTFKDLEREYNQWRNSNTSE